MSSTLLSKMAQSMLYPIVLLGAFFLLFVVGEGKFIWKDCGSKLGKIEDVKFTGCAHITHMGCRIVKGTNVTANITFTLKVL